MSNFVIGAVYLLNTPVLPTDVCEHNKYRYIYV